MAARARADLEEREASSQMVLVPEAMYEHKNTIIGRVAGHFLFDTRSLAIGETRYEPESKPGFPKKALKSLIREVELLGKRCREHRLHVNEGRAVIGDGYYEDRRVDRATSEAGG